jgi:ABC-type uncharacterized transport system ATPase subunit
MSAVPATMAFLVKYPDSVTTLTARGAGKTTLLRMLAGDHSPPLAGW